MKAVLSHIFLLLLTLSGTAQSYFNRAYDIPNTQTLAGIEYYDNYFYSAGWDYRKLNGEFCLYKFEDDGDTVFIKCYADTAYQHAFTINGPIKIDSTCFILPFNKYGNGAWIMKFDENGDTLFTKKIGTITNTSFVRSIMSSDSNIVICGQIYASGINYDLLITKLDFNGNVIWQNTFNYGIGDIAYSVSQTSDGGYVCSGYTTQGSLNPLLVVKFDSLGVYKWHTFLGMGYPGNGGIRALSNGKLFVAGNVDVSVTMIPDYDFYFAVLDSAGNILKEKKITHSNDDDDLSNCIIYFNDNKLGFIGQANSPVDNFHEGVLMFLDTALNIYNVHTFRNHTEAMNFGQGKLLPDKSIAITGYLKSGNGYDQDAWLVRVDSMGCFSPGCWLEVEENEIMDEFLRLKLYPNPTNGIVQAQVDFGGDTETATLSIYDATGRLLQNRSLSRENPLVQFNVEYLESGIYHVVLRTSEEQDVVQRLSVIK